MTNQVWIAYHDVSQRGFLFEKQTTVSHLRRGVMLYGENTIEYGRSQLSPYPKELVVSMVQKHLKFRPFNGQQMLTERLEIPCNAAQGPIKNKLHLGQRKCSSSTDRPLTTWIGYCANTSPKMGCAVISSWVPVASQMRLIS